MAGVGPQSLLVSVASPLCEALGLAIFIVSRWMLSGGQNETLCDDSGE